MVGKSGKTEGVELMRQRKKGEKERKLIRCSLTKIKLSFVMSRRGERERFDGRER